MTMATRLSLLLMHILLLGAFWWLIVLDRPDEVHFEYLKLFCALASLYFVIDGFRAFISNRYESRLIDYLGRTLDNDAREIEEIPPNHPLRSFYNLFVPVLEKFTRPVEPMKAREGVFPSALLHRVLSDPQKSIRQKASDFLHVLHTQMPNAEIFLFGLSGDRIALIDFSGTEEISRSRLELRGNWLLPFSPRSDFSGKCSKSATPVFTNELKSDSNLGQFLSESNPNLPIYGALFPIGFENDVRGLLWIRDGAGALEKLQENAENFLFAARLLYDHFEYKGRLIDSHQARFEDLYLHFESQSRQYLEIASAEHRPVAALLFFVRTHNGEPEQELIETLRNLLLDNLPPLCTVTREYGVFHCLCYGMDEDKATVTAALCTDVLLKHLQFGLDPRVLPATPLPEPAGSVNAAATVVHAVTSTQSEKLFDFAREALRTSITAGPNQIRVTEEQI